MLQVWPSDTAFPANQYSTHLPLALSRDRQLIPTNKSLLYHGHVRGPHFPGLKRVRTHTYFKRDHSELPSKESLSS